VTRKRDRIRHRSSLAISALYVPEAVPEVAAIPHRARRHEGHPHPLTNGLDTHRHPLPDEGPSRSARPAPRRVGAGHNEAVERNLAVLAEERPEAVRSEEAIYGELIEQGVRPSFAAMAAHQEIAAALLAAGATLGQAADRAGVTEVTVSKYWADASFRRRVAELRSVVADSIHGRIIGEFHRRTQGRNLRNMELSDVAKIFDRVAPKPGAGERRGTTVAGNLNVVQLNYEGLAAEIRRPDTAEEGPDFPLLGPGGPAMAGGSPLSD
jgi:hypothetical protein